MLRRSGPFRKVGLAIVTSLAGLLAPPLAAPARAAEPAAVHVRARIDRAAGRVRGTMTARVRVGEGEDHVRLWLYPARLAEAPAAMDERSARWIYPGEVDRGGVTVDRVQVGDVAVVPRPEHAPLGAPRGRDTAGGDLLVPIEPGAARTIELTLRFALSVPGRFGRLGRDDGVLSLAAPWYPLVVGDDDAWEHDAPHRVEVVAEGSSVALLDREVGARGVVEARVPYVPVVVSPRLHVARARARGVELVLRTAHPLYQPPPPQRRGDEGLTDLARVDVVSRVREVAEQVFDTARAFGVPVPERLVMVEVRSRTELVATAPGVVLFSDRLFQIFPIDQTLDFHRRALRRALFAHLLAPRGAPGVEAPADRGWSTDLRAVVLVDLDEGRRRTGAQTPQQLLELFSFHPAVDQLLYAPQIAFEDAYFAAIEERDPFRDDPIRARRPLSRGRRILEMARDALEPPAFERWVAMLVNRRRSARAALRTVAPTRADRLGSWLAATGEPVNYRLGEVRSEPTGDGRWRHVVEVFRDGATRVEPVEVRVVDDRGHAETATWEGEGARGEVRVVTPSRLGGVTIDPRHRLPQSPEVADGHPRVDDATDHPWRPPILNGFLFNALVSEGDFTGLIDFALRRRYDLEHTIGLRLERTRAFTGGTLRYSQGIGPKVHTNRRMAALTAGLSFDRLHEFFGDGELGGWRGQATVAASLNTVAFSLDPREGFWGSVALTGGVAGRDDGTVGWTLRGGLRAGMVLPLGLVNALAVVVGGGFTAGEALLSELQGLGGSSRLRGFESGEHLGRGVLYGVVEHRWTALRDLALNLAHLVWVREIQLAVFAGAGAAFDTIDGQEAVGAADVGAGVRVHYEYGGVQPGVITLDLGLPLTRTVGLTDERVIIDGEVVRRRVPIGFYIGFDQYF